MPFILTMKAVNNQFLPCHWRLSYDAEWVGHLLRFDFNEICRVDKGKRKSLVRTASSGYSSNLGMLIGMKERYEPFIFCEFCPQIGRKFLIIGTQIIDCRFASLMNREKEFSILKVAEDSQLIINIENVGPLKSVDRFAAESEVTPTPSPAPSVLPSPSQ